ncbi:MAG: cation:proton antiporter [Candidatus Cloacimonadales bacterium]
MSQISLIFFFLAVSLLLSILTSRGVSLLKSPLLLGYIIAGAVIGIVIDLVIPASSPGQFRVDDFEIINIVTLALIGFGIGTELEYKELKKVGKMVLWITIFEASLTFIFVSTVVSLLLHFAMGWDTNVAISLGLLFGSFASATAPAGTVDVIKQYKASGSLVTTLYAVLGLDDIFALLIFTITLPISIMILSASSTLTISSALMSSIWEILISISIGSLIGYGLAYFGKKVHEKFMVNYLALGSVFLMCGLAEKFHLSPILINMFAGIVAVNKSKLIAFKINHALTEWSPPIYVWFFVLIGTRLDIGLIQQYWILIIVYIISTMIGKYNGAYLGAVVSKAPAKIRKYLGFTLLSQAGVAIGLSMAASKYLVEAGHPEEAKLVTSVMTMTTFLIMMIAPNLVKYGLIKSGEAKLTK